MSAGRSYDYAIDELWGLLNAADLDAGVRDLRVRYVCALFAELAYHHIPKWEMDEQHRAKVIPCEAYDELRRLGRSSALAQGALRGLDFPEAFTIEDRGVIAVGVEVSDVVFIGFRGTMFLYDWKINARSQLVPVGPRFDDPFGRVHAGFAEEALRISLKIGDVLREKGLGDRRLVLSGHSLGGAVAALARNSNVLWSSEICIFGSPRYADLAAYAARPTRPPLHVRRATDEIPTVPPKRLGYIDHPYDFTTGGTPFIQAEAGSARLLRTRSWAKFVHGRFAAHSMETYRGELGFAAGAQAANLKLTDFDRLTKN